jgi:hypothetical protein
MSKNSFIYKKTDLLINGQNFVLIPMTQVGRQAWNSFLEEISFSYLHHSYEYIEALKIFRNSENISFALTDSAGKTLGLFPLISRERTLNHPLARVFRVKGFFVESHGGFLSHLNLKTQENVVVSYLEKHLQGNNLKYGELYIDYDVSSMFRNYEDLPFRIHTSKNRKLRYLNLEKDLDYLWKDFRENHRRMIKKAQSNSNLNFSPAYSNQLDEYYELHRATHARSNLIAHPLEYFNSIFNQFVDKGAAIVGCVREFEEPIAYTNYGIFGEVAHFWTAAINERAYKLGANHLCHWQLITHLKELNIRTLVLGEIFDKHVDQKIWNIGDFKRGFGSLETSKYVTKLEFGLLARFVGTIKKSQHRDRNSKI